MFPLATKWKHKENTKKLTDRPSHEAKKRQGGRRILDRKIQDGALGYAEIQSKVQSSEKTKGKQ